MLGGQNRLLLSRPTEGAVGELRRSAKAAVVVEEVYFNLCSGDIRALLTFIRVPTTQHEGEAGRGAGDRRLNRRTLWIVLPHSRNVIGQQLPHLDELEVKGLHQCLQPLHDQGVNRVLNVGIDVHGNLQLLGGHQDHLGFPFKKKVFLS